MSDVPDVEAFADGHADLHRIPDRSRTDPRSRTLDGMAKTPLSVTPGKDGPTVTVGSKTTARDGTMLTKKVGPKTATKTVTGKGRIL